MSDHVEIKHERRASEGRYVLSVDGQESELTYILSQERMILMHTYVPPAQRGHNHGQALVRRAVEDAKAQGLEIVPVCWFARAELERLEKDTEK